MSKKKKDWKAEKERLLRLDREERRREYRRQDYVCLDKIPTWREENISGDADERNESTGRLSQKVSLYKGDITVLEVDAIVNAANSSLLGGGGVDGCIHKAAGSCLYDECHSLNGCETGKAKITCGYDLPARYVIHTVGPVARGHVGDTETNDLTSCYQNSLRLLQDNGLSSVAFPCISTGIYGFPNEPAADIALNTVKSWMEENPDQITRVIFCVFLETDFSIYKKKMSVIFQDDDMEVTEEVKDADKTASSSTCSGRQEKNRGEEEAGGEDEGADDAAGTGDVVMESQNLEEDSGVKEKKDGRDRDQTEARDKDKDVHADGNKDKDEDKEEKEAAADEEAGNAAMKDVCEGDEIDTSGGDETTHPVQTSEEAESERADSFQSKDAKKE